jgi:L-asparaginase
VSSRLRIAHLAGPTATIQNTPPLVTSNKARALHGLPPRAGADGEPAKFDALRAQRLAAPAKVYVEQFSAHPLESDAAELYGPPDGFLGEDGAFSPTRRAETDKPVFEIEIRPEDGLYPLPYMARQADGQAWEDECATPGAARPKARQGFFPDGSRSFEEIDRLGIGADGLAGMISGMADVDFYRVLPPSGYMSGRAADRRTDQGSGAIEPEKSGRNFFPYKPYHLGSPPPRPALAKVTNDVQAIMRSGDYDGAIWTQGSPNIEETSYWFNLLIDTTLPIACNAAQRPQGQLSNDGPQNIVDSLRYIASRVWADAQGCNRLGTLLVQEQQFFAAREVAKADARPGGYVATGGHGGILGQISHAGRVAVTYLPAYKHTHLSELRITVLPREAQAVRAGAQRLERVSVPIKDASGQLLETAIPVVSIVKDGGYCGLDWGEDPALEVDLKASIDHKLSMGRLTGFVIEGLVPYGNMTSQARLKLMIQAVFAGLPVVRVGRGAPEGFADLHPFLIAGSNLTATKARLLLMACLMKFGSLPTASDPANPTPGEKAATTKAIQAYQTIFDTH